MSVTASSEITREWREFERTNTTALNAYVKPIATSYLNKLNQELNKQIQADQEYVMHTNGETNTFNDVKETPINMVEAERPAPVSNYFITLLEAVNIIQKALVDILPHRLIAGHYAAVCSVVIGSVHPASQQPFMLVEPTTGGWGVAVDNDGQSGQFCYGNGETYNVPIEVTETRCGVLVEE